MPQIGERIFVLGGNQKYCALTNEELVRYIGTDWTAIRIGLLVALNTDGTNNITGRLGIGVCSGSTNPLGASSTTLFVGTRTLSGGPTWTYNANGGFPYFNNGVQYGLRRVGASDTTAGIGSTNMFIATNTGSLQRRSLIYVDLNKAGSEVPFPEPSAQMANDFSFANWLEGLEYAATTPMVQNISISGQGSQSLSFDETPGPLDHVDVQWTGTSQALEIYAWGVWRRS